MKPERVREIASEAYDKTVFENWKPVKAFQWAVLKATREQDAESRADERERCAKIAEGNVTPAAYYIAAAIRQNAGGGE